VRESHANGRTALIPWQKEPPVGPERLRLLAHHEVNDHASH
jgi:hypothetical protein